MKITMPKFIKLSVALVLVVYVFSAAIMAVGAAGLVPDDQAGKCPEGYTGNCGNYQLNDLMKVVLNVSDLILQLVGSLALLAFIAGGLMWLLSAGNAEWVTRGKQTVMGAVIGLAIVFTSFMIIQLVFTALGIEKASGGKWSVSNWYK